MARLIDVDALKEDLQSQFEAVFIEAGRKVKPEDYFIERHAAWFADTQKAEKDSFFEYLESRPTVDAQPVVHGRWDVCEDDWNYETHYICSACGEEWVLNDGTPEENNMNFCPNCGAKMDLEV